MSPSCLYHIPEAIVLKPGADSRAELSPQIFGGK
jgi:hypothetical protein